MMKNVKTHIIRIINYMFKDKQRKFNSVKMLELEIKAIKKDIAIIFNHLAFEIENEEEQE